MKKNIILLFTIIVLICLFAEAILGITGNIKCRIENNRENKIAYCFNKPRIFLADMFLLDYTDEETASWKFRKPDGTEYKTAPILLLGCSYTNGYYTLKQNQTFSHKLSYLLKRPVYNRAFSAAGLSEMLYQVEHNEFYEKVPPSRDVIYIFMFDHYRRFLSYKFFPVDDKFIIHYKNKKNTNDLVIENYDNSFMNFLKSTYIFSYIDAFRVKKFINNPKNAEKLTDLTLLYFLKIRENLEKHWHNKINFTVVFYNDYNTIPASAILKTKLEKNGFGVIFTKDLTEEDLTSEKYSYDAHPTEAAWDLLTPKIIKAAGL